MAEDGKSMRMYLEFEEVSASFFTDYKLEVFHPFKNKTLELMLDRMPGIRILLFHKSVQLPRIINIEVCLHICMLHLFLYTKAQRD